MSLPRITLPPLAALLLALAAPLANRLAAHEGEEHGNHDAAHGGFVLMYEDLHFELVALPGALQIHYSDARRAPLPAAVVSELSVELERGGESEPLSMAMSAGGDYWEGHGAPLGEDDVLRIGFVFQGEPLLLDVPASFLLGQGAGPGTHGGH